ncbi:MAG TPA: ComF family protein [Chthoniobacterales bacterium]|nr:ComF family protein [Chthoniobacterales bacterium]
MQIDRALEPLRAIVSLFYPALCAVCHAPVVRGDYVCQDCLDKAQRIVAPLCAKCSEPFPGAIDREFTCANCADRTLAFNAAVAAYRSRGVVRFVILQFKYNRQLHLRHPVAEWLQEAMSDARLRDRNFDCVVPVPLHPARFRERGFNQAELLAKILGQRINLTVSRALERTRYTTTQTAFDRVERMENLRGAFRLRKRIDMRGLQVLLVDDILTTGSTLSECARVLREAGAHSVYAVTAARA